ncbi:MAG: MATE family efflux transporter, partial [Clostridia bacterium]
MAIQSIINGFGTSAIAGYAAAVKFNNFAVTSFSTLGTGVSNFTAQNLGAG